MKLLETKKTKKLLFLGLATATLLTACGGNKSNKSMHASYSGESIQLGSNNPICQEGDATQSGKVVNSSNQGIENVTVEIAGCTASTDKNGNYTLSNIPSVKRVSVNYNKDTYIETSKIITIPEETENYIESSLAKYTSNWTYKSEDGSNTDIVIDENTKYNNDSSKNYVGDIHAYYSLYNTHTTQGRDTFPGSYEGLNSNGMIVAFTSYAYLVLNLKDEDNNPLYASKLITIKVKNIQASAETIPLWFYNKDKGIWIEDGVAQRDQDGNYICEISETGTWSISKPIETEMGIYTGHIIDENENPMANVRLQATGKNWKSSDLTTDKNGEFTIYVTPNESFELSAYNYKEKYGAAFPTTLEAISSGDMKEE